MEKEKIKLLSKAFHAEYGIKHEGELLKNWCAKPIGDDSYEVVRSNGTSMVLKLGQKIKESGVVSLDQEGNLMVGNYAILKGENLAHDITAKKTRAKDEYMLSPKDNKKMRVKIGDSIDGMGTITGKDQYGNLKIGEMSIPIEKKIKELKILVFDDKNDKTPSAYNATFSLIEPGKETNYKDGIPGIFIPSNGKKPAQFCERVEDEGLLTTAIFWPSKNKQFCIGRVRTLEQAKIEKSLFDKIKEFQKESSDHGINPDEHFELVQAKSILSELNNEWTSYQFSASNKIEVFGLEKKKSRDYTPSGPSY